MGFLWDFYGIFMVFLWDVYLYHPFCCDKNVSGCMDFSRTPVIKCGKLKSPINSPI
jgi:hypothetical protein